MAKKICIFSAHYFPYLGGVESFTYNLAKALIKKGDQVVIVTSNDMKLASYQIMDGIPVYRMPCFNLLDGRFPVTKPNRMFRQLDKRLMKMSFDLVLVNTRFYLHSVYGVWLAKRQAAKCIVLDHSSSHMTIGSRFWDWLGGGYEHFITAVEKHYCRDFYGVSRQCCKWLEHFHIKPCGTIYNAVDAPRIEALLETPVRDFKKENNISADTLVITYTGRLLKEKGIYKLIEAVKRMPAEPPVRLLIAGSGEELETVRRLSSETVIPLGRLTFEAVVALLGQTDIFCLPTAYPEGFPTSVLEAAAAGCYIITTARGGSQELLLDDRYGMIIKDNEAETIQKALAHVIARPGYREAAAARTKQRLREHFTWDIISEQVHRLQ